MTKSHQIALTLSSLTSWATTMRAITCPEGYCDALCSIGAKLARLALEYPDLFFGLTPIQAAAEASASTSA